MIVCSTVIAMLIGKLESGKSSGPDNISLESLKFANNRLSVLLYHCVFRYVFHMVICHLI